MHSQVRTSAPEVGEIIELPPRAAALAEAMRDIGYSLEAAIADIIDNSLTAEARCVDIAFGWLNEAPWICISDDGCGMTEPQLLEAMRTGSRSPREKRALADLGRFGLGLKTASFSQCRRLTVISSVGAEITALRWDLDHVQDTDRWEVLRIQETDLLELPGFDLERLKKGGTAVLWQKIDRLDLSSKESSARLLNAHMSSVREHVALVFHRYLSFEVGRRATAIRINLLPVEAFDPYGPRAESMNVERVQVGDQQVLIHPFILPHHSRTTTDEYERLAGAEGYLRNQGFYVYRNRRLIIWGTWFRLAKQEELTKLARVKVDIPNTLDHLWSIDVRKSRAQPPDEIRMRMRRVLERIRGQAKRPYSRRGVQSSTEGLQAVWQKQTFNNRIEYKIERGHPVVAELLTDLDEATRQRMDAVLRMVERSFPIAAFFNDYAMAPNSFQEGVADLPLLMDLAALVGNSNPSLDAEALSEVLKTVEPFASHSEYLDEITREAVARRLRE